MSLTEKAKIGTAPKTKDITIYNNGMKHVIKNVPEDSEVTILSPARKNAVHATAKSAYRSRRCAICKCCSVLNGDCLGGCEDGQKHKLGAERRQP